MSSEIIMAYYQNDKHKTVLLYALAVVAIQVIDIVMLAKRLSAGTYLGFHPGFFVVEFAVVCLYYYLVMDRNWKFGMMFVVLSIVLEYFGRLAGLKSGPEGSYIAACGVLVLAFTLFSMLRFKRIQALRILLEEKGYAYIRAAFIVYVAAFVLSNITVLASLLPWFVPIE
jgi:hypothetical protein